MNNNLSVTGNLVADPEIKYFDSGTVKTTFSIAVTRNWTDANGEKQEQTSFFDITAWRYAAEDAARTLMKGSRVTITGRMEQQTWEDKESGSKRSKVIIVADEIAVACSQIESYERRKREDKGQPAQQGQSRSNNQQVTSRAPARGNQGRPTASVGSRSVTQTVPEDEEPF